MKSKRAKEPVVEFNTAFVKNKDTFGGNGAVIMVTPAIDENYWVARVRLYRDQAVQCFPKFGGLGCGFAQEEDWNTNLPVNCPAEQTAKHIFHNKKYKQITLEQVIAAIEVLQKALLDRGFLKQEDFDRMAKHYAEYKKAGL